MKDRYGREIDYMRISITERCNLRCRYCMPKGITLVPMKDILTYEEILEIVRAAVSCGITKFKVTGGEPLVRKDCVFLVRNLKAVPGVEQVTLTTNGILLDEYADGNRKYYPSDEVRQSLDALALDLGYWFNHGDVEDTNFAEVFFFRFLEQAVRLSPQVDFVSDFHCNDGSAGILNFHEWSPNPLYSFLVYPSNGGLRVRMVGDVGDTKIMKLFHLSDDAGRDYYLCSNNGDLEEGDGIYRVAFRQFLFLRDGDNLSEVASYSNSDFIPDGFDGKVVFNPQSLRWDCCKMDGDKYVPVANSKSLHLNLDGKNSRIIVR